ncbi:secreted frizzled-related protein 5 [Girardinichthys multiradiatus]|uniref:secreted frizzled-related protein 5 n=1 Tax=Girardinichthys multiradiatus TaxID=208333 RepID=UPI001FAC4052|nr:secreted frizzled-related protein 5 [Girardinichthys multiradiatus]
MSSYLASFLFLLLLARPSKPSSPGRGRPQPDGHIRTEDIVRSVLKNKGRELTSVNSRTEIGFGVSRSSKHRLAAAAEDGEAWGEPDILSNFGSTHLISDSKLWEPRISSRCVPIPSSMALCHNIGYDTMRIPNLLGHDSPAEAVQQSASWLPLLARECHPDARIFLCSLFAPICLDRFISPCRSLCESVRESCAPIMSCYGYPWPEILRCDQYPADHLVCISSITNASVYTGARGVPQASCRDCELEEAFSPKETLESFCKSDFIVKLRLTRLKYSPVSLSQFSLAGKLELLKRGTLSDGQIHSRIELWLERDATCVQNMTRQHPRGGTFLVTGTVQGERLVVNKAYAWQKRDRNLTAAVRKWKSHRCRN